jgi:hypothetical protein
MALGCVKTRPERALCRRRWGGALARVDLKAVIASKFGVDLSKDQIARILKQRG